jgi:type I restriction enzyme M protein
MPLRKVARIVTEGWSRKAAPDELIRYVAISDIDPLTMEIVNQQEMQAHEAPSRATYRVRTADILTAVSGASTGTARHASALVAEESNGAICSNGLAVLRDVRTIHPLYLLAYLRTPAFLRQVRRLRTGHAIPAITLDDLGEVLVAIPSSVDQTRTAGKVDELQSLRRAAIAIGREVVQELSSAISYKA